MDPRILALAVLGASLGLAADRLAARWPTQHAGTGVTRAIDWRTAVMALTGALAFGALATRWAEPRDLVLLGVYFATLTVLMATDLDQRVLPDPLTLSLIPVALILLIVGLDPLLNSQDLGVVSGLLAGIGGPVVLIATSFVLRGGIGSGDLKLAVSLGLVSGTSRLLLGFIVVSAASSLVLIPLLAARRITRRSAIPFGPVLIVTAMIAALVP